MQIPEGYYKIKNKDFYMFRDCFNSFKVKVFFFCSNTLTTTI